MSASRSTDVCLDHTGTFAKIPCGIGTGKCGQRRKQTALCDIYLPYTIREWLWRAYAHGWWHVWIYLVAWSRVFIFLMDKSRYLLLPVARHSRVPSTSHRYQIYLPCGAEHGISVPGLPNAYPATAISLSPDVTGTFASPARIRLVTLQVRKRNVKFFSLSLKENGETVRNDEFLRLKCLSLFKRLFLEF